MEKFKIVPEIYEYMTFKEFLEEFPIHTDDLLLTQRFIYAPFIEPFHLNCHIVFQEDFGEGEPSDEMVDAVLQKTDRLDYNRVIAVGGGTVIDIAKLLSLKTFHYTEEIFNDPSKIKKERELLIIPTTCGTGSEVTRSAIIASIKKQTKVRMAYDAFYADKAILIPEFIHTLPYRFFAYSSIDALIHAVESYLSPKSNAYTDLFAEHAIKSIINAFVGIAKEGQESRNKWARDVLGASNYAGISFGNAGCGAVHALAFPLSGRYHVAHGESNYQFFCAVLDLYYEKDAKGKISRLLFILAELLQCKKEDALCRLEELLDQIWKIKKLRDFGMQEEEIEEFADEVYEELQPVLATSYVQLSREELEAINRKLF
ncbi:iron-containing alcohol dehydrogenase [Mediterraneibacter massiliensis]|uniref:iron-containing alcohol dehydrogenase n=1 Tax=Mediterraneibacter massiliensis TaxID=1720300 RepID=UPI0024AE2106|nr:iron-containing alcohol dehydrogenase [Mediterraneibacter massiliensis]